MDKLFNWMLVAFVTSIMSAGAIASDEKGGDSTVYKITDDATRVETTIEGDAGKASSLITQYLSDKVIKSLRELPLVTQVDVTTKSEKNEKQDWADYRTFERESVAFVTLKLATPVSFYFDIKDEYNVCEAKDGKCSSYSMKSEVKFKGPIKIYGLAANQVGVRDISSVLKDTQELSWSVSKNHDDTALELSGRFEIKSSMFEANLLSFFDAFNVGLVDRKQMGRQQVLLSISRLLRMINEKVLELR